jgi:hypothetical protein
MHIYSKRLHDFKPMKSKLINTFENGTDKVFLCVNGGKYVLLRDGDLIPKEEYLRDQEIFEKEKQIEELLEDLKKLKEIKNVNS